MSRMIVALDLPAADDRLEDIVLSVYEAQIPDDLVADGYLRVAVNGSADNVISAFEGR